MALTALLLAGLHAPLAFRGDADWVVINRDGVEVERFKSLAGLTPEDVVLTDDGETYVFTAYDRQSRSDYPLLFLWKRGTPAPLALGLARGKHTHPALTPDDQWVYFAYHNDPHLMGLGREYTQIWKVRIDGVGLQQLTNTRGCKLHPRPLRNDGILYSHADCEKGERGVESMASSGSAHWLLAPLPAAYGEPAMSPDGQNIAVVQLGAGSTTVLVLSVKSGRARTVASFPGQQLRSRLEWLSPTKLILQHEARVLTLDLASSPVEPLPIAALAGGSK